MERKINAVRILSGQTLYPAALADGSYRVCDVCVKLEGDKIYVTADQTAVAGVEIVWENCWFGDEAKVLGDAFERGYADLGFRKPDAAKKMPWYFLATQSGSHYGFGVKTGPNAICSWQCSTEEIILHIDIRNGAHDLVLNGRELLACETVFTVSSGDLHLAAQSFCRQMCDAPRKVSRPIYGGNDWYCNYGNNDFDTILLHTRRIVECAPKDADKPYMVIDDGWQLCHSKAGAYNGGPWIANINFKDMQKMAEVIKAEGAIPGIWYRPLQTTEYMPEEWLLKRSGLAVILDPSVPEVLDIIRRDAKRLTDWGYQLIKHDFSTFDLFDKWGFMMDGDFTAPVTFADKTRTTAEIIKDFYRAIREGAGEECMIIGCNTVSHLSAGIFEIQRTGDDTSGREWKRTRDYGINTLAFRMPQHDTFYQADADCVGITTQVDWAKNSQWLDVLAKSGTPLFVSIAKDAYSEQVKADLTKAFEKASKNRQVSWPLDWEESMTPSRWRSVFGEDVYSW